MNGFLMGFRHGTLNGPLCEEEVTGVCFIVKTIELVPDQQLTSDSYGSFTGQIISVVKDLCRQTILNGQPRLVEGVYKCSLTATQKITGLYMDLLTSLGEQF